MLKFENLIMSPKQEVNCDFVLFIDNTKCLKLLYQFTIVPWAILEKPKIFGIIVIVIFIIYHKN
jgi:hypothetical protein